MGVYLNPGNDKFYKAINSEIYVDKTGLIQYTNRVFNTMQQNVCVSRPQAFWKIDDSKYACSLLQQGMPVGKII